MAATNYVPSLNPPPSPNFGSDGQHHGHGSPEGVVLADQGETYTDDDSGDFWGKITGGPTTKTGWVKVGVAGGGGGGGGLTGQLVRYTSGSPANPTDVTKPAIAYDPNGILPNLNWDSVSLTWK